MKNILNKLLKGTYMEQINTEILVSSLIVAGFDKVDFLFYTYILGKISLDNQELNLFEFQDKEYSEIFKKYIDFDGTIFQLKNGYSLDMNVFEIRNENYPLKRFLNTNKKLIEYINNLDIKEIIFKKINDIGYQNIEQLNYLFSNKEKEIMYKMFGIEDMHIKMSRSQIEKYRSFSEDDINLDSLDDLIEIKKKKYPG